MAGGRGRKPIDLEMHGKKGNRQRVWEAMRVIRDGFTAYEISRRSLVDDTAVRSYLQSLIKGGFVEVISGAKFEEQTLHLVRDVGAEAPAITREGKPSKTGKGTEAMWRTLRILGEMDADELAEQASIAVPTTTWTARSYLKWLKRAGYVVEVQASTPGKKARYRLAPGKYTGPRPPMIQRIGQVFDPNLGEVVFRQPEPAEAEL
ncbi:hypothetical protein SAMN05216178_3914 [Pseudomonas saponiphila]|uniref:Uncharacterized protein n=1 Tax=Pseudomonas saponiphila TaxID=556534 RepID=A0A1H4QU42_9PSED|nr:hypothetical protein [Pseudomonas saponiphila]SEC23155.1 hypothetical protein SAMN05216178_3914 [Pseudomonas saponiphila]